MRVVAAVVDVAEGAPERALEVLAPVIGHSARTAQSLAVAVEAQVLDASTREGLGDAHGAEASREGLGDAHGRRGVA